MVSNMAAIFREYVALERRRSSEEGMSLSDYQRWAALKRQLNKHFQPGVKQIDEDRRGSVRVPVRLRLGFKSYGEIRNSLMTNLSRGGVFIATRELLPMGSRLDLRIKVEESGQEIEVEGEVASHNSGAGLLSEEIGMGIKFVRLTEEQEKAVDNLYEQSLRLAIEAGSR